MLTANELEQKINDFKLLLLDLDCELEKLNVKRNNMNRAIDYLELDLAERMIDNALQKAIDDGKYPL